MPQGAIPLGSYLYLFLAPSNQTDCLISAHGGYSKNVKPLRVPNGVNLFFYAPHDHVLTDPGLDLMAKTKGAIVVDHWTSGTDPTTTFDYSLSKYQNSEKTGRFRDIMKKIDGDYGKHNQAAENYTAIMTEIQKQDNKVKRFQGVIDNPNSKPKSVELAVEQLKMVSGAMNVLTVRNRFNKSDVSLSYAIAEVIKRRPSIVNFHCSFCRGLDTEDNTPSYKVQHQIH